jgi:hypothetical protein
MRKQHDDEFVEDPALRRELEALFDVRPSPTLAARVRAEIAREPVPATRWWQRPTWTMAWGLAAACVVLTLINWWLIAPFFRPARPGVEVSSSLPASPSTSSPSTSPSSPAARPPAATAVARAPSGGAGEAMKKGAPVSRLRVARAPRPMRAAAPRSEPEVLVAADEARALRALIAGGRDGRVRAFANEAPPPSEELSGTTWTVRPMEPIVLAPIRFDPVPRVGDEEGVQQ